MGYMADHLVGVWIDYRVGYMGDQRVGVWRDYRTGYMGDPEWDYHSISHVFMGCKYKYLDTLSDRIGNMDASHAEDCRVEPG